MYCRGCGKELNNNMAICMGCGVPVGKGNEFCPACGSPTNKQAVMCVNCGIGLVPPAPEKTKGVKSRTVAGLLGIFLGGLGAHNFYIKRTGRAVCQLLLSVLYALAFIFSIVCGMANVNDYVMGILGIIIIFTFLGKLAAIVWGFIEAILLLCGVTKTDGRGRPFRD